MLNNVMFIFKLPANLENHSFTQVYRFSALPLSCIPSSYMRLANMSPFTDTTQYCLKTPQDSAQAQNRQKSSEKSITNATISS